MRRIAVASLLIASIAAFPAAAQSQIPAYVVVGDSIEFGFGDDIGGDGAGYVPLVAAALASFIGTPSVHNFGQPFADTRDIWRDQVPEALAAAAGHAPVIVSWGNALLRTGCAPSPEAAALGTIVLEGQPDTVLDRGLNDRIRSVAERYNAQVVDIFGPFAALADTLVSSDCIHPSGAGYQAIAVSAGQAFLAAQ